MRRPGFGPAPETKTLEQQIQEIRRRQEELESLLRETKAGGAQDEVAGTDRGTTPAGLNW